MLFCICKIVIASRILCVQLVSHCLELNQHESDTLAEWLRRKITNLLHIVRAGSIPAGIDETHHFDFKLKLKLHLLLRKMCFCLYCMSMQQSHSFWSLVCGSHDYETWRVSWLYELSVCSLMVRIEDCHSLDPSSILGERNKNSIIFFAKSIICLSIYFALFWFTFGTSNHDMIWHLYTHNITQHNTIQWIQETNQTRKNTNSYKRCKNTNVLKKLNMLKIAKTIDRWKMRRKKTKQCNKSKRSLSEVICQWLWLFLSWFAWPDLGDLEKARRRSKSYLQHKSLKTAVISDAYFKVA